MKRIGILSDTHSHLDKKVLGHLKNCDEIWHAGDIGSPEVIDKLCEISQVRAVYGNIDGQNIRSFLPEIQLFEVEGSKVLMTHIAGYPGRYNSKVRNLIEEFKPDIVVCGHSHILKIIYDKKLSHLHINPGAAGISGFHRIRTMVRLSVDRGKLSDMEVVEMKR
ncbi:MAG: metallophosphoesterase family protein [Vicingaceae bacterium]